MIEAAIVLPVFLLLFSLTVDIGRAAYTYVIIGQVAQAAARTLSLPDSAHSDCLAFTNSESNRNGYTIAADPNSVTGDADPVATPSAPTQGSAIAANTGDLYLYPAVATASPPDNGANCTGTTPRAHYGRVTAQITFEFVPWTPIAGNLTGPITIVAVASVTSQY